MNACQNFLVEILSFSVFLSAPEGENDKHNLLVGNRLVDQSLGLHILFISLFCQTYAWKQKGDS